MKRAAVLACAALAVSAGAASGAAYVHHLCRVGEQALENDGLIMSATEASFADDCPTGGALTATLTSKRAKSNVQITYTAPPDTSIEGITLDRATDYVTTNGANYSMSGTPDACSAANGCNELNGPVNFQKLNLSGTTISLSCPDNTACDGPGVPKLWVRRLDFALRDDLPPTVNAAFPTSDLSGTVQVPFDAADRGGGVFQSELIVDGSARPREAVDANGGLCQIPFVKRVPCRLSTSSAASLDTTTLSNGDHQLALSVYDATGVNVTTVGPVTIHVKNGQPAPQTQGSSSGTSPGVAPAGVRVVPRRTAKVVDARYDRPFVIRGRLLDASGAAIAGVEVGAFAAPYVPGGKERLVARARTGPSGGYRLVLPAGPSQRVTVRPTSGDASGAWTFRTRVIAPVRLLPSRKHLKNGDRLLLTAYLDGRRPPAGSADIAFQVLIGTQWRTFAQKPLDKRGFAQVFHRFKVTYQRMTYRFRVLTLRRKNFPYENARSRPVAVRVN